jgi:hypothetical protein
VVSARARLAVVVVPETLTGGARVWAVWVGDGVRGGAMRASCASHAAAVAAARLLAVGDPSCRVYP